MDISGIPNEYFDSQSYFKEKDKKLREKGYVLDKYGRPIRRKKVKLEFSVSRICNYTLSGIVIALLLSLLIAIHLGAIRWGYRNDCVPGFTAGNCERKDFLDTYFWEGSRSYKINGNVCTFGVAFRVWAPLLTSVHVMITNDTATARYPMRLQNDGAWFVNVCNVNVPDKYYFEFGNNSTGISRNSLSLGGREILYYEDEVKRRNSFVYSMKVTGLDKFEIKQSIIYQLFLPSFCENSSESFFSQIASSFWEYLSSISVSVIQLFPLEQYRCNDGSASAWCWNDITIEYPGVAHKAYGSYSQFQKFVTTAHEYGIRVIMEVNWSLFSEKTVLYNVDNTDSWGSLFQTRQSTTINGRHRLDFSPLKLTQTYIKKIIQRWRDEVGIDGIQWQHLSCMVYSGSQCLQKRGQVDYDAIRMLKAIKESSRMVILGDSLITNEETIYDAAYDYTKIDEMRTFFETSNYTTFETFLKSLSLSAIYCFDHRHNSNPRFVSSSPLSGADRYRAVAIAYSLFYEASIPCLFMGSDYFEDDPFLDAPTTIRLEKMSQLPYKSLRAIHMDLVDMKTVYGVYNTPLNVTYADPSTGLYIITFVSSSSTILGYINMGGISYSREAILPVPYKLSIRWVTLFSTENPSYYSEFESGYLDSLSVSECVEFVYCAHFSLHAMSVRYFVARNS